jgi:hypothetical protein
VNIARAREIIRLLDYDFETLLLSHCKYLMSDVKKRSRTPVKDA